MTEAGARRMPSDSYGATLTTCYDSFSQDCEDNASIKVVLLAGVKSGNEHKQRNTTERYELSGLEVWAHIARNEDRVISRLAVSMLHTEVFLRALSGKS